MLQTDSVYSPKCGCITAQRQHRSLKSWLHLDDLSSSGGCWWPNWLTGLWCHRAYLESMAIYIQGQWITHQKKWISIFRNSSQWRMVPSCFLRHSSTNWSRKCASTNSSSGCIWTRDMFKKRWVKLWVRVGWGDLVHEINSLYLLAYDGGAHVIAWEGWLEERLTIYNLSYMPGIDGLIENMQWIKPHNSSNIDCSGHDQIRRKVFPGEDWRKIWHTPGTNISFQWLRA